VPTAARVAKNESLFREVNERIAELEERFGARDPNQLLLGFVCECATIGCTARVEMSVDEYLFARERPDRFLVAPGHVDPDYERIVLQTDRFTLVEKFGLAGEIASDETD
jgi:hypothetical protein